MNLTKIAIPVLALVIGGGGAAAAFTLTGNHEPGTTSPSRSQAGFASPGAPGSGVGGTMGGKGGDLGAGGGVMGGGSGSAQGVPGGLVNLPQFREGMHYEE